MGAEKQLITWKFGSNSVRVDVDGPSKTLKVEGKVVVTVTCVDGQLVFDWVESWKSWAWLHDSVSLRAAARQITELTH